LDPADGHDMKWRAIVDQPSLTVRLDKRVTSGEQLQKLLRVDGGAFSDTKLIRLYAGAYLRIRSG
jgi:hypothetical protein